MTKLLAFAAVLFLFGCSTTTSHLSVIVPEGVQISEFGLKYSTVANNVSGSDTAPMLLFFPIGQPSFDEALHRTLRNGRGQILTNAVVTDTSRWLILFGWNRIEITGDVIDLQ